MNIHLEGKLQKVGTLKFIDTRRKCTLRQYQVTKLWFQKWAVQQGTLRLAKHFIKYMPNSQHALKWHFMWLAKLDTGQSLKAFKKKYFLCHQIWVSNEQVWQVLCEWLLFIKYLQMWNFKFWQSLNTCLSCQYYFNPFQYPKFT